MSTKRAVKKIIRTCVVCGKKDQQARLYRFVQQGGKPVFDRGVKRPGRGAYCCMNDVCHTAVQQKEKYLRKAFRI